MTKHTDAIQAGATTLVAVSVYNNLIAFAIAGAIVGSLSWYFKYTQRDWTKKEAKGQAVNHVFFGLITLPAAMAISNIFLKSKGIESVEISVFIAGLSAFTITEIIPTIVDAVKRIIGKKGEE